MDTSNGQPEQKTFVVLGCERVGSIGDTKNLQTIVSGTRKCDCPFRVRGRWLNDDEGWILKLIYRAHNHDLSESLVGYSYVGRLNNEEKWCLLIWQRVW